MLQTVSIARLVELETSGTQASGQPERDPGAVLSTKENHSEDTASFRG